MPRIEGINKVMVIGSGPIVIGQAAEFDYAGTQACRVLKQEGMNVVLVNSNPATIMTDQALADEIYLEPLTKETIRRVIEKEKPDGLLAGFGGQNGLTLAMQLDKEGFFEKTGVRLLGTNAEAIDRAEDRKLFKEAMEEIGQPVIPSGIAQSVEEALKIAEEIGYPVIVRPAFTLGGGGGGVGNDKDELPEVARIGLEASPIHQILIERYIYGWKEIEFEVMRDGVGNAIAICSMENVDPVGVHTGDSIVVAPAVTLSMREYGMLKNAALDIVSGLNVVGGCNCQFALNPNSFEYAVIEVNPRVSRSSALASKATGYPIAKVSAKIALGYTLDEIQNDITKKTCACFEPSIDYIVVKFPRWPFDKFAGANRKLGTQMKATGEVMSIAPSFEMALMKAVRGAEIGRDSLGCENIDTGDLMKRIRENDDQRIFYVFEAIKRGADIDEIFEITRIDRWFLWKIKNLADFENEIGGKGEISRGAYLKAKSLGYTDRTIIRISGAKALYECRGAYRMVDTCAGEFQALRPYFYWTAASACESRAFQRSGKPVVLVLGSGPIRIGQGIEFDYSSVHCVRTLRNLGYEAVIINNNPETVSTDYDTADRLYFEPLSEEDVLRVIDVEKPVGVVVAFGGQTAIRLTQALDRRGIRILGTSAEGIDVAEDRARFDALLSEMNISRPKGMGVKTLEEAVRAANDIGYPVLLRPSYVIGGQNMKIAHSDGDVKAYMNLILSGGIDNPVLIDKYMKGVELEVDVISDGRDVLIPGVMEHIERAGVHSGDSIAVYPPYNLSDSMLHTVCSSSTRLALALGTKGLVNIQYLIWRNELYVIEVNPRASRTIPYISKVTGVPMVEVASRVMLGENLKDMGYGTGLYRTPPYYTVKAPVFSFEKLTDANSVLGPEMKSTGEVLGVGRTLSEALFKGLTAAGMRVTLPSGGDRPGVIVSVDESEHHELARAVKRFYDRKMRIYATRGTARAIERLGIPVTEIGDISDSRDAFELIESGKVNFVVYTDAVYDSTVCDYNRLHRSAINHQVACFTSLDTANAMADVIYAGFNTGNTELVDICHMRKERMTLKFTKMQDAGNDYIIVENFDGLLTCPETLSVTLCMRQYGIGADGMALIEKSDRADASIRMFNSDGSVGKMAGNCMRMVAKYLYDNKIVLNPRIKVEMNGSVYEMEVFTVNGSVGEVRVNMGRARFSAEDVPVLTDGGECVNRTLVIGENEWKVTCVSVGNPHAVVFTDDIDTIDVKKYGSQFENAPIFPERVNTEFVRVVNENMLRMRVWERGNGETLACGTGACAAVAAAVRNGLCHEGADITVKLSGGDLIVRVQDGEVFLTGGAEKVFDGAAEY
ncbi:MAG: carbamoyl-phosphate synthase large subunit [Clostridia bacterium]|nr:carbamoyl-phosphate synthase large subunit [Clostridia bacterium]